MKQKDIVILAAAVGAGVGVLAVKPSVHLPLDEDLLKHLQFRLALLGWVAFSLYWEIAAKGAAKAEKSESGSSRAVHVFLANAALLLELAPLRVFGRFVPISSVVMTAGVVIEAAGLALAIWARRHLGRYWSGEISIKVDHQLIRTGPYRILRHPIYTGLITMYLGAMIVTGEWLAVVGFLMAAFAYWRKIRLEESNLDVAFGPAYDDYRRQTWALVPGLF